MKPANYVISILSFNHPELTARCVRSAQRAAADVPLYLLHNGSDQKHTQALRDEFKSGEVTQLNLSPNAGFSGGANYLINSVFAHSPSDWILLLTNDCQLQTVGEPPPQPGLYAPLIYRRALNKIDSIGATFEPLSGRLRHLRSEKEALKVAAANSKRKYFYVPGTAFWVDRKTWRTLKGFDESLHTYWEDVDFSVQARQHGLIVGAHSSTTLIHGVGKTCHKNPFYTQYLFQRNRKIIARRYSPRWIHALQSIWL